jgi:hypothetical protein
MAIQAKVGFINLGFHSLVIHHNGNAVTSADCDRITVRRFDIYIQCTSWCIIIWD